VIGDAVLSVDVIESSPNGLGGHTGITRLGFSCYPNPFANSSTLSYTLPVSGNVTIELHNALGTPVQTLVSEFQTAGSHAYKFDATSLPQGVYTATIRFDNKSDIVTGTIKLIISK
jgi:hypothetical protein